jgi:LacI family repressor for deo operon, udp, cdd, tsx, nupC, and nupG
LSKERVTIRDVAARAGVSHQTVSRVINDSARVRPETRARVMEAIAELGYHPNALARSMARGRSHTVACIAPNLTDYTFASLISGAEIETRRHGYYLLSASAVDAVTFAGLVTELVISRRVEGLMVINPYADERQHHLPQGFPLAFAGARPRGGETNSVALDDVGAGYQATQHLLQLGHRQIGMITGPLTEDAGQDRCQGYEEALQEAGIAPAADLVIEGNWLAQSGYDALMQLAQAGELPSAVFAQNDLMAVGVLRAARDLGLQIPRDLSVIGVDDIPLSSFFDPPLTTFRQDFHQIGVQAARLLIRSIEQPQARRRQLRMPVELVVRRSTAVYEDKN